MLICYLYFCILMCLTNGNFAVEMKQRWQLSSCNIEMCIIKIRNSQMKHWNERLNLQKDLSHQNITKRIIWSVVSFFSQLVNHMHFHRNEIYGRLWPYGIGLKQKQTKRNTEGREIHTNTFCCVGKMCSYWSRKARNGREQHMIQ